MKEIKLTQGFTTLVDDDIFEYLSQWKWYASKVRGLVYAIRKTGRSDGKKTILMHREIMKPLKDMTVDHIDHNGLNNQRYNLRVCTFQQNHLNRKACGRFKFLGVSTNTGDRYIQASIKLKGKSYFLGNFKTQEEAAIAYDKKAIELFGEYANLNFPELWVRDYYEGKIKA